MGRNRHYRPRPLDHSRKTRRSQRRAALRHGYAESFAAACLLAASRRPGSISIIRRALVDDARRAAAKRIYKSLDESGLKQTNVGKPAKNFAGKGSHIPVKTAAEYRAMAEECFKWAREARVDEVRVPLLQLAQIWLDAASKLDSLPSTPTQPAPDAA